MTDELQTQGEAKQDGAADGAKADPPLPGHMKFGLSRAAMGVVVLIGLVLAGAALVVGSRLVGIEPLAHDTRTVVVAQQHRALATESLVSQGY